jgi:hypothetical protein
VTVAATSGERSDGQHSAEAAAHGPSDPPPASRRLIEACPLCGAALHSEQDWCLSCGAAARTRLAATPNWRAPAVTVAVIVALALGVLAAALVKLAGGASSPATTPTATITAATPTTPPATTPTAASTSTPTAATTPTTPPATATRPGADGSTTVRTAPGGRSATTITPAQREAQRQARSALGSR